MLGCEPVAIKICEICEIYGENIRNIANTGIDVYSIKYPLDQRICQRKPLRWVNNL